MFLRNKVSPGDETGDKNINFRTKLIRDSEASAGTGSGEQVLTPTFLFHGEQPSSTTGPHSKVATFSDIVDPDERSLEDQLSHVFAGWLVDSLPFRMTMLVIILLNSLVIGIQTDRYLEENYSPVFLGLDKVFLTLFVMEILIKWYHNFFGFWRVGWNVFDFVIVAASLLGPSLAFLSGSRVLRILRVLRALRSLRSISALRGLQIVVHTVFHSIPDMANIVALLFICMFIFAVLGSSFFGNDCPQHFGSLGTTMFALFVCVTQDGWMGITEELQACGNSVLGSIYLLIFITIGAFIFANLVVAVVVTNLEWAIAEQKELEVKQKHSKPETAQSQSIVTVNASDSLHKLAHHQKPLEIPEFSLRTPALEHYFLLLSALETNLSEFKTLQEQLGEILQEVRALSSLEEVSDDDIFELSGMAGAGPASSATPPPPPPEPPRRRFFSLAYGDALSDLIAMNQRQMINSSQAHSVNQLMTQLHPTHPAPSGHSLRVSTHSRHRASISGHSHQ